MKKFIDWLGMSNRWKHLIGGLIIGILHSVGLLQCMPEYWQQLHWSTKTRRMAANGIGLISV